MCDGEIYEDDRLWHLENPPALEKPIPINAKLNLWTLPGEEATRVEQAKRLPPLRTTPTGERRHGSAGDPEQIESELWKYCVPSTIRTDRGRKRVRYREKSAPGYWIVELDNRRVERCRA